MPGSLRRKPTLSNESSIILSQLFLNISIESFLDHSQNPPEITNASNDIDAVQDSLLKQPHQRYMNTFLEQILLHFQHIISTYFTIITCRIWLQGYNFMQCVLYKIYECWRLSVTIYIMNSCSY